MPAKFGLVALGLASPTTRRRMTTIRSAPACTARFVGDETILVPLGFLRSRDPERFVGLLR